MKKYRVVSIEEVRKVFEQIVEVDNEEDEEDAIQQAENTGEWK